MLELITKNELGVSSFEVIKYRDGMIQKMEDQVAMERPLEIRLKPCGQPEQSVSITMRTPGGDKGLALGFLFTEGILTHPDQVQAIHTSTENTIVIEVKDLIELDLSSLDRNFYSNSSCGVCGKSSLDSIRTTSLFQPSWSNLKIAPELLFDLQAKLRERQSLFQITGGIHAAALFDSFGKLLDVQEDVGRHNALDKLIGASFLKNQMPLSESILMLSGRLSFELVQKAYMAGIPIIVAVGAPSSLAIELAQEVGITLIGFLKQTKFNLYSHHERIKL